MSSITGAHNVLQKYEEMVAQTSENSKEVVAAILSDETRLKLSPEITTLGDALMDGQPATIVAYNSLGSARVEMVSLQVPICNVHVTDSSGVPVRSQVTAQVVINDGVDPYYAFDLHFEGSFAALGYSSFIVTPEDSTQHCAGFVTLTNDTEGLSSFAQHVPTWPPSQTAASAPQSPASAMMAKLIKEQRAMETAGTDVAAEPRRAEQPRLGSAGVVAVMENQFYKVYVDTSVGLSAVYDKGTGKNYSLTHQLMEYRSTINDAYSFKPAGPAVPLGTLAAEAACQSAEAANTAPKQQPTGVTQPKVVAASVSLGPVMQEIRLQVNAEHKTRVRLWVSDDPTVGGRIELAHRIGVLEPMTEIVSRFHVAELSQADYWSEDNGYETIKHASGTPLVDPACKDNPNRANVPTCWSGENASIPRSHYPSQMSVFLDDGTHQLGVALDRSHGTASLANGTLDVVQHRRGGPTNIGGVTPEQIVLDDVDRLLTETWLSIGNSSRSNALRHSNKLRLNHPLVLLFARTGGGSTDEPLLVDSKAAGPGLPPSVHLQAVRATAPSADEVLISVLNVVGAREPGHSTPAVDLATIVQPFRPALAVFNETTLNGLIPKAELKRMQWRTEVLEKEKVNAKGPLPGRSTSLSLRPFEMRTFMAKSSAQKSDDAAASSVVLEVPYQLDNRTKGNFWFPNPITTMPETGVIVSRVNVHSDTTMTYNVAAMYTSVDNGRSFKEVTKHCGEDNLAGCALPGLPHPTEAWTLSIPQADGHGLLAIPCMSPNSLACTSGTLSLSAVLPPCNFFRSWLSLCHF